MKINKIKKTEIGLIPKDWDLEEFESSILQSGFQKNMQINSSEIKKVGKIPVIDQGQKKIAGWTDKEDSIFNIGLPVVVFGDHTRIFKYIDFPFVAGADGTKILKPNLNKYDPKFFYYVCLAQNIPSKGYNRHFKSLKEKLFIKPRLDEQRKIAYILTTIQNAIEKQEEIIKATTELKKAMMQKFFTEGLNGEKQKETGIGLVQESWEIERIGDICKLSSGGTPSRTKNEYWQNGSINWVKTGEINYKLIVTTEEKITEKGLKNSAAKIFSKGTLLIALYGQGITRGKVAILGIDAATNQACSAIIPYDETKVLTDFLYYYFEFSYDKLRMLSHGANQKNLSATIIKSFNVPIPKVQDQHDIVKTMKIFDAKLDQINKKKDALNSLFNTSLNKLMTGQKRVNEIDFPSMNLN